MPDEKRWSYFLTDAGSVFRALPGEADRWDKTARIWEPCPWMRTESLFIGSNLDTAQISPEHAAELTTGHLGTGMP